MTIDVNLVDAQLEETVTAASSTTWLCPRCGREAAMCNCSGGTTNVHRQDTRDFWANDEDSVYDKV